MTATTVEKLHFWLLWRAAPQPSRHHLKVVYQAQNFK